MDWSILSHAHERKLRNVHEPRLSLQCAIRNKIYSGNNNLEKIISQTTHKNVWKQEEEK